MPVNLVYGQLRSSILSILRHTIQHAPSSARSVESILQVHCPQSCPRHLFHLCTRLRVRALLSKCHPAISMLFIVRSGCSKEVDSGRKSATAMGLAEVMSEVDDRKVVFRAVFRVKAALRG